MMRISQWWERVQSSLFYVPLVFTVGAVILAELLLLVDARFDGLPDGLAATVESARSVLSVIAGATLSFAGIAFSVSLLLIASSSSQFSPRVVHGLFRDPYNKRVMGIVVGTFVYCLVVLRSIRGPLDDGSGAVIPSVSVLVGLLLGLGSVLAIIAFINHSAHSMEVSTILDKVTEEALREIRRTPPERWQVASEPIEHAGSSLEIRFDDQGWVQAIDDEALLKAMAPGAELVLATAVGRYALPGGLICRVWPEPPDPDPLCRAVVAAVLVGDTRTLHDDATFGVRQLADVALRALSPGTNDPTTAQDAILHMAAVVRALLTQPRRGGCLEGDEGRRVLDTPSPTDEELIGLAFDEIRVASVGQPTVLIYLLETLRSLGDALPAADRPRAILELRRQARLAVDASDLGELLEADRQRVREAYARHFGS